MIWHSQSFDAVLEMKLYYFFLRYLIIMIISFNFGIEKYDCYPHGLVGGAQQEF